MALRATIRDAFGGEDIWGYGGGSRWTGPRPHVPDLRENRELPSRTIVPGQPEREHWHGNDGVVERMKHRLGLEWRRPKNFRRIDSRVREDICERLWDEPTIDVGDVDVQVKDGVVTLEGTVPYRPMKHLIEDIAADTPGVHEVENRLRVARHAAAG